jgi:hypothetical protein
MLCTLALFPSRLSPPPSKAIHLLSHLHPSNALHCTRSAPSNENSPSSMHPEIKGKENQRQTPCKPPSHPPIHRLIIQGQSLILEVRYVLFRGKLRGKGNQCLPPRFAMNPFLPLPLKERVCWCFFADSWPEDSDSVGSPTFSFSFSASPFFSFSLSVSLGF